MPFLTYPTIKALRQELMWFSWRLENDFVTCSKLLGNDTTVGGVKDDQMIFTFDICFLYFLYIYVFDIWYDISNVNHIISSTVCREKK